MAITVNIHDAKTHLSKLLERVRSGEEVIIAKAGTPVARLVSIETSTKERHAGTARGMIEIGEDFDTSLPLDVSEALFYPVTGSDARR